MSSCTLRRLYFDIVDRSPEPQILDFQAQQVKLFGQLANAIALTFVGMNMSDLYSSVNKEIQAGNIDNLHEVQLCFSR